MVDTAKQTPPDGEELHTYTTHHIPWYVRAMWIIFWVGLIFYVVRWAIPAAKEYF